MTQKRESQVAFPLLFVYLLHLPAAGLQIGVVRRAHHGPAGYLVKAQFAGNVGQLLKLFRGDETIYSEVAETCRSRGCAGL